MLDPLTFAFLLIGASLPYYFSSMTMHAVSNAAMQMIIEVSRQFSENPALLESNSTARPDYEKCVRISTVASLREMIGPGALVMVTPILTGTLFGVSAVYGLLIGALLSGLQMAVSMANSGGAWDNSKKFISSTPYDGVFGGTAGEAHKAAVIGDTVGDPMKDTSGPSINILMKLMAIISLVFAEYFFAINNGKGLLNL